MVKIINMDFKLLAQKLKKLRERLNITQVEASERTGVSSAQISKLEAADADNPQIMPLVKLAVLYGVPISYLVDDNQDDFKPHVEPFTMMIANISQQKAQKIVKIVEIILTD